ncbi:MAG: hypothetical protein ACK6CU_01330 [Deltaproteobacteria bacterium]
MSRSTRSFAATFMRVVPILAIGCGGSLVEPDAYVPAIDASAAEDAFASTVDAVTALDATALDAALLDAASFDTGATTLDAAFDPILAISGSCGTLDDELLDERPYSVENTSTFAEGFHRSEGRRLSAGAQTILAEGTAGGSSGYSEAFAFEVLHRCEGAELVASETMVRYTTPSPSAIADLVVDVRSVRVGVSVTRAVTVTGMCMRDGAYSMSAASALLSRKVADLHEAATLVGPEHAWTKNLVFVYADTAEHARVMGLAWEALDASLRADTVLYVSVSESMDAFVYFEDRC